MSDDASAQALGALIAGTILLASIGTLLMEAPAASDPADVDVPSQRAMTQAASLTDILLSEGRDAQGERWQQPGELDGGRLGLTDAVGGMDFEKIENLNKAPWEPANDGFVSYLEVRDGLVGEGLDFHVRAYPVLPTTDDMLNDGVRHSEDLEIVYIGDHFQEQDRPHIRVCTVLLDQLGRPVDGSDRPAIAFRTGPRASPDPDQYPAAGELPETVHATPLDLNADLLDHPGPDGECTTHYGLSVGGWYYNASEALGGGPWFDVLYHDLHDGPVAYEDAFYAYSPLLWDEDPANDEDRTARSDGQVVLTEGRPHRTLVVVHRIDEGTGCTEGDAYCESDGLVCHKPGTSAEKTMRVAADEWDEHIGHGDGQGPCSTGPAPCDEASGETCDEEPVDPIIIGDPVCTVQGDDVLLEFDLRNHGITDVQFHALVEMGGATVHAEHVNTGIVPAGATADVRLQVPLFDHAPCDDVHISLFDVVRKLAQRTDDLGGLLEEIVLTTEVDLFLDTATPYTLEGDPVLLDIGASGLLPTSEASLTVRDEDGTIVASGSFLIGTGGTHDIGQLPLGMYEAELTVQGHVVRETVLVNATAPDPFTPSLQEEVAAEDPEHVPPPVPEDVYARPLDEHAVLEVEDLAKGFDGFCPYYWDADVSPLEPAPEKNTRCGGTHQGDIYPDDREVLNHALPERLLDGHVDVVVVGSHVLHTAMSDAAAKDALRDWVLDGGTLVVLGSDEQNVVWLERLLDAAVESSSSGLYVEDLDHPVLHVPNPLGHQDYPDPDANWRLDPDDERLFTSVVREGDRHALAVSNLGAFGDGRVVLTGYMPYMLEGERESTRFFTNLMLQGYRGAFLDYGPPLPEDGAAVPATRTVTIDHPDLGPLPMTVRVYVIPQVT